MYFFFNDTATTEIYTLSLHDALPILKLMGTGLATAILLDATIVRMLLVPATMELLGDRNWWLPRWLDRLLPKVNVEGDRKSTRLNSSHANISYAVFCLKKKKDKDLYY